MTQRRWGAFLRKTPKIALPPHTHANMHTYVCTLRSKTAKTLKHTAEEKKQETQGENKFWRSFFLGLSGG